MADRVAAEHYGEEAFRNGLTFVIKRDIEFRHLAVKEIEEAKSIKRKFNDLYHLPSDETFNVQEGLDKALNAVTTENDTHPAPADRFRYIKGIKGTDNGSDERSVSDLFTNWRELTTKYTLEIEKGWMGEDAAEAQVAAS